MRLLAILLATSVALTSCAQTTREAMIADPLKCAGLYRPYPDSIGQQSPVPSGYAPFYVGHYGRHGSRYLGSDNEYFNVYNSFTESFRNNKLTDQGKSLWLSLNNIVWQAKGRGGQLAPLGYRQHRAIAGRMYKDCARAFDKDAKVTAVSTTYMRCAHSMFAFVEKLRDLNPKLDIPMESGDREMSILSPLNDEAKEINRDGRFEPRIEAFRLSKIHPERFMSAIFIDPDDTSLDISAKDLMWRIYMIAIDLPNLDTKENLFGYFTPDELFDLWQAFNYRYYTYHSVNPDSHGVFIESVKPLLKDFIDKADAYIESGEHGATLRFGHDSSVIPLAGLLQFPIASGREGDPDKLYKTYADWRVSPMASNIQMRLYRNKRGDIIAKFMLNEHDMPLPDTPTDIYPYYRWSDARATLQRLLDTPCK